MVKLNKCVTDFCQLIDTIDINQIRFTNYEKALWNIYVFKCSSKEIQGTGIS